MGSELRTFIDGILLKSLFHWGQEKVQFILTFYLKQNKEVQLDLQRLSPEKMLEEKLTDRFS